MQSLPTNVLYDLYCPKSDRWFRQGKLRKRGVKIHPFHLSWIRTWFVQFNWPKLVELIASWAIDTEPTRARGVIIVGYSWPSF